MFEWATRSNFKMGHSRGSAVRRPWSVLADGRMSWFLKMWTSIQGDINVLMTSNYLSLEVGDPRENKVEAAMTFMT